MTGKRVESEWNKFEGAVMPKDAHPIQHKEMKRAFYAGVWAMLQMAEELGYEEVSEDAGIMALDAIQIECMDFMRRVGKDF